MSSSGPFTPGSRVLFEESNVLVASRGVSTRQAFVLATGLTVGQWFVFHVIDPAGEIAETREDDNVVRQFGSIMVQDC